MRISGRIGAHLYLLRLLAACQIQNINSSNVSMYLLGPIIDIILFLCIINLQASNLKEIYGTLSIYNGTHVCLNYIVKSR